MGYSVGRWEGDTFVVETIGQNGKTWLDMRGLPGTEALRVTERYTRPKIGHIDIDVTIDDPKAYTKPWDVKLSVGAAAGHGADREHLRGEQQGFPAHGGKVGRARRQRTRRRVYGSDALNGALAIVFAHMIATRPPSVVMSTNAHVSCSTLNGSVSTFIATRATSLSGV